MNTLQIKIGNSVIGHGQPVYIIAELACAHEGDFDFAQTVINRVAEAKSSAIKFQIFTADGLVVPKHKLYNVYKNFQFSLEQWSELADSSRKKNLDVLVDVFDPWSLKVATKIRADGIKVHSTNVTNSIFLEKVVELAMPVLIGTGGTYKHEIETAIDIIRSNKIPVALIHGFQDYPTSAKDTCLKRVQNLMQDFDVPVGFAGHAGREGMGLVYQNILAMGCGCNLLENHITLDASSSRTDYHSSLLPKEFEKMVSILREMEIVLGKGGYEFSAAEQKYRTTFKTYIVSANELEKGHVLNTEDFVFKRADYGIFPDQADKLIGKTLIRKVSKDEPLVEDLLANNGEK